MSRLDRYIFTQIAIPTAMALGVVSFLAVANEFRSRADELPAGLLTPADIVRIAWFLLPGLIAYVIPITFFFGILFAFGRLAGRGEIMAMRAAGISLKRIATPVILLGVFLSLACFVIQDKVRPWAINNAFNIMYREIPQRATLDMLTAGVMHEYEGWRIYFGRKDPENGILSDFDLIQPKSEGGSWVYHAASARLTRQEDGYVLRLEDGHFITADNLRSDFAITELSVPAPSIREKSSQARMGSDLTGLHENARYWLTEYEATHSGRAKSRLRQQRQEIAERISLPFAALAMAIAGAPLAIRTRRASRSYVFALGFAVIVLYYVLLIVSEPEGVHDLYVHILRAWVPNLALIAFGYALLWRVDRV